jgi:hypothetical protein
MKPRKHIHVKYYWKTYFKSIGTLSQTFKNHIHNKKEIQDQYPRENEVLFTGEYYFSDKLNETMEIVFLLQYNLHRKKYGKYTTIFCS